MPTNRVKSTDGKVTLVKPALASPGPQVKGQAVRRPDEFEGFVHRILGPDGKEWRWLARSIFGHVAHGRTPDAAVKNLRDCMEVLADTVGLPYAEWYRLQKTDGSRLVRAGELVPA